MKKDLSADFQIRKAVPEDAEAIHGLLRSFADQRLLLPRPVDDILEKIRNFSVALKNGNSLIGCCALRCYGGALYEIRSLAVAQKWQKRGIASAMVKECLRPLQENNEPARIFTLTYQDGFFSRLGFKTVDKNMFPQKIWSDCWICPKKKCCDEIAMLLDLNGYQDPETFVS